ncbi:MAG: transposase [Bdellovibrionota bacterium]
MRMRGPSSIEAGWFRKGPKERDESQFSQEFIPSLLFDCVGGRPFSKKLAIHIVLRSSQAKDAKSFLRQGRRVDAILMDEASKRSVKLHGAANAGNHLHLLVQAPSREYLNAFMRAVSGRIAMLVTGTRKGKPLHARGAEKLNVKFWDQRPFSRLVSRGRDFLNTLSYISLNLTESAGVTRNNARAIFREIRERLERGEIARSPSLMAAGFV